MKPQKRNASALLYRLASHVEMAPDSARWNAHDEIVAAQSFNP
jgi:hypothetical protein